MRLFSDVALLDQCVALVRPGSAMRPGDRYRLPVLKREPDRHDRAAEPDDEDPARCLRGREAKLPRYRDVQRHRAERIPDEGGDAGPQGGGVNVLEIRFLDGDVPCS